MLSIKKAKRRVPRETQIEFIPKDFTSVVERAMQRRAMEVAARRRIEEHTISESSVKLGLKPRRTNQSHRRLCIIEKTMLEPACQHFYS